MSGLICCELWTAFELVATVDLVGIPARGEVVCTRDHGAWRVVALWFGEGWVCIEGERVAEAPPFERLHKAKKIVKSGSSAARSGSRKKRRKVGLDGPLH